MEENKPKKIYKSIKYRIFPTEEQKKILNMWFGARRWCFNELVNLVFNTDYLDKTNYYATSTITLRDHIRKNGPEWITQGSKYINSTVVENAADDFSAAYKRYKRSSKNPNSDKFKPKKKTKKESTNSCSLNKKNEWTFQIRDGKLNITTTKFFKRQTFYTKKDITIEPLSIKQIHFIERYGRYYVILIYENQVETKPYKFGSRIGIDLGLKTSAVTYDGNSFKEIELPEHVNKLNKKKCKIDSKFGRSKRFSKNYVKYLNRLRKAYDRMVNYRNNWQDHLVCDISRNYETIIIDKFPFKHTNFKELNPLKMSIAPGRFLLKLLNRSIILQNSIYSIKPGIASTQTCSCCGNVKQGKDKLTLNDRVYKCGFCNNVMDRDRNSAKFIYDHGLRYSILEEKK